MRASGAILLAASLFLGGCGFCAYKSEDKKAMCAWIGDRPL